MSSGTRLSGQAFRSCAKALTPGLGISLHIQLLHLRNISAKDVFLACPFGCISLLCAAPALAPLCGIGCSLPVLTSQPVPTPALLCPRFKAWPLDLIPPPSLPHDLNRDLPVSCQAPPLGARGPPLNICKTSPGSSAPSAKLSSTMVP